MGEIYIPPKWTKFPKEHEFYHTYKEKKVTYRAYMQRITKQGWTMQEAIVPGKRNSKYKIDDSGRECSKCEIYKPWEAFAKDYRDELGIKRTSQCKECRNKKKKEYRQSYHGQIKTKNYRVIKRADPNYREKEKRQYQAWQQKNRERLSKYSRDWSKKHPERVKQRRKDLDEYYYRKGKKVFYNGVLGKIMAVEKWKGCLVQLESGFRIWIAKNKLKPEKPVSKIKTKTFI